MEQKFIVNSENKTPMYRMVCPQNIVYFYVLTRFQVHSIQSLVPFIGNVMDCSTHH